MGEEGCLMVSFITSQLLQISADEYLCYPWLKPERQTGEKKTKVRKRSSELCGISYQHFPCASSSPEWSHSVQGPCTGKQSLFISAPHFVWTLYVHGVLKGKPFSLNQTHRIKSYIINVVIIVVSIIISWSIANCSSSYSNFIGSRREQASEGELLNI